MSESIQATVIVADADVPVLDAVLVDAQKRAGGSRFTVQRASPSQATVALVADDHASLIAGIQEIGPAFVPLGGRARVDGLNFSVGVSSSVRARVNQAAS